MFHTRFSGDSTRNRRTCGSTDSPGRRMQAHSRYRPAHWFLGSCVTDTIQHSHRLMQLPRGSSEHLMNPVWLTSQRRGSSYSTATTSKGGCSRFYVESPPLAC